MSIGITPARAVFAISWLWLASDSQAQTLGNFTFGTWEGSVQFQLDLDRERERSDNGPEATLRRRRTLEQVSLRNNGYYLFDPRLLSGNLGATLGLLQDSSRENGKPLASHARLTGYSFDTTAFGGFPYSGKLFADRAENFFTQPFGRTDVTVENRGAGLRLSEDSRLKDWGWPFFNASLRGEQQHVTEATRGVAGQNSYLDQHRDIITHEAHKGFQTADLEWRYEYENFRDTGTIFTQFHSHSGNLNYSQDFGATRNARWDSRLSDYERAGTSRYALATAEESLHIDHRSDLSSDYRYFFTRVATRAGISLSHNLTANVSRQLYKNLSGNAQLGAQRQDIPTGRLNAYSGQLGFSYQHELPWDGKLSERLGGREQLQDNRLTSSQIDVVDESHAAPSPLGAGAGFLLNQGFVVEDSIVVIDTRGAGRLPAVRGVDYDLVQEGNLVRIVPIASSLVIRAGDPLAISYSYQVDPSIKYRTDANWANVTFDFGWVSLALGHDQTDQNLLSGHDGRYLQDLRREMAQLDLRGAWRKMQAQGSVSFTRYDSTHLVYNETRVQETALYRPTRSMLLALTSNWTRDDYSRPVRSTDLRAVRLAIDRFGPGRWSTNAQIGYRVTLDSDGPTESIGDASIGTRLQYGKFSLSSDLSYSERKRDGARLDTWRFDLALTRSL